jgi:hypothetical protein
MSLLQRIAREEGKARYEDPDDGHAGGNACDKHRGKDGEYDGFCHGGPS